MVVSSGPRKKFDFKARTKVASIVFHVINHTERVKEVANRLNNWRPSFFKECQILNQKALVSQKPQKERIIRPSRTQVCEKVLNKLIC